MPWLLQAENDREKALGLLNKDPEESLDAQLEASCFSAFL